MRRISVILMSLIVFITPYFLGSGLLHLGDYYIKNGEVRQFDMKKNEPPALLGFSKGKYISRTTPTAKNPYVDDITLTLKTNDKHTFNLFFRVEYYLINDFTVDEMQNIIDGKIKRTVAFHNFEDTIKNKIMNELSQYTKEELHSKMFISEKLQHVQDELMKSLPFKIKLFA